MGALPEPLPWVNEVDGAVPPPIVFVRRCIDVDVRPDWHSKPAKCCSMRQQEARSRSFADCSNASVPTKPTHIKVPGASSNHSTTPH